MTVVVTRCVVFTFNTVLTGPLLRLGNGLVVKVLVTPVGSVEPTFRLMVPGMAPVGVKATV